MGVTNIGLGQIQMVPANELASPLDVVVDGEKYRITFTLATPGKCYILYASVIVCNSPHDGTDFRTVFVGI